jgi:hypothetical protein
MKEILELKYKIEELEDELYYNKRMLKFYEEDRDYWYNKYYSKLDTIKKIFYYLTK